MSRNRDYIPRRDADFYSYMDGFMSYVDMNAGRMEKGGMLTK
jgi:hypothetical protein